MKRKWMGFVCLATGLFVVQPTSLLAQRNKKEPLIPASEAEYKALKKVTKIVGKVVAADDKELVFKLEFKQYEVDSAKLAAAQKKAIAAAKRAYQGTGGNNYRPNYNSGSSQANIARRMASLQRQMAQLQSVRDPRDKQRRYQSIMRQMQSLQRQQAQQQLRLQQQYAQQLQKQQQQYIQKVKQAQQSAANQKSNAGSTGIYKIKVTAKDFEVPVAEDVIVRRLNLPFAYDDKGNVKKYTAEDLKKLKGDNPKLPGYAATIADLENGQTVQIYFGKSKEKKGINLGLEKNRDAPTVTSIVILAEAASPLGSKK